MKEHILAHSLGSVLMLLGYSFCGGSSAFGFGLLTFCKIPLTTAIKPASDAKASGVRISCSIA